MNAPTSPGIDRRPHRGKDRADQVCDFGTQKDAEGFATKRLQARHVTDQTDNALVMTNRSIRVD